MANESACLVYHAVYVVELVQFVLNMTGNIFYNPMKS